MLAAWMAALPFNVTVSAARSFWHNLNIQNMCKKYLQAAILPFWAGQLWNRENI
jgi:hypothetical protein